MRNEFRDFRKLRKIMVKIPLSQVGVRGGFAVVECYLQSSKPLLCKLCYRVNPLLCKYGETLREPLCDTCQLWKNVFPHVI